MGALWGGILAVREGPEHHVGQRGLGAVKPSLAPSSSLCQGKGRQYLLLGLSWARLWVHGAPSQVLWVPREAVPVAARPRRGAGRSRWRARRVTSASSCTSTMLPGCPRATSSSPVGDAPSCAAPRPEGGEGGLGRAPKGGLEHPRWQPRPPCFSNPLEKSDLSSEPCSTALPDSGTRSPSSPPPPRPREGEGGAGIKGRIVTLPCPANHTATEAVWKGGSIWSPREGRSQCFPNSPHFHGEAGCTCPIASSFNCLAIFHFLQKTASHRFPKRKTSITDWVLLS